MFGKLFESMYEGSLYGHWQALVTFQQMIILSEPDGTLDVMPHALAARTSIPLEIILAGIELLEQPDLYSRSAAEDGRRIVRLDPTRPWGWRVVNKDYYRKLASAEEKRAADRTRIASKRACTGDSPRQSATVPDENATNTSQDATCREVSREVACVAHADADADADADKNSTPGGVDASATPQIPRTADGFHQQIIAAYHELLPDLPAIRGWPERRRRKLAACINERLKAGKAADGIDYWRSLFEQVSQSDFLCGRSNKWRCPGLEWLLEPTNFLKVIEGAYRNNGAGNAR